MLCKNKNRFVALILFLVLLSLCFTACRNTNVDDKSADLSSSQTGESGVSSGNSSSDNASSSNTPEPNPDLPDPPTEKEYSAVRGDVSLPIDMDLLKQLKVNIVTPDKYSAWPMLGIAKGRLVCLYTVADQHSATTSALYMKTSSSNGISSVDHGV